MDWIDSQQQFLQLENESLHHFLSFSLFSSSSLPSTSLSSSSAMAPFSVPSLALSFKSSSFLFTPHSSLQCSLSLSPSLAYSLSPSALPSSQHLINICLGFHSLSACRHLHTCTPTQAHTFTQSHAPCLMFSKVEDKKKAPKFP